MNYYNEIYKKVKDYFFKLVSEVGKIYNARTLRRIRQFYVTFKNWSTLSTKLTWSHYVELLKFNDINNKLYKNMS